VPVLAVEYVVNGTFGANTVSWTTNAALAFQGGDGVPAGSAQLTGEDGSNPGSAYIFQCIDLTSSGVPQRYSLGAYLKAVNYHPTGNTVRVEVQFFDNSNCTVLLGESPPLAGGFVAPQGTWFYISRTDGVNPPANTSAARVRVGPLAEATPTTQVRIDGVFFSSDRLFNESFETGTTVAWSAVVP